MYTKKYKLFAKWMNWLFFNLAVPQVCGLSLCLLLKWVICLHRFLACFQLQSVSPNFDHFYAVLFYLWANFIEASFSYVWYKHFFSCLKIISFLVWSFSHKINAYFTSTHLIDLEFGQRQSAGYSTPQLLRASLSCLGLLNWSRLVDRYWLFGVTMYTKSHFYGFC